MLRSSSDADNDDDDDDDDDDANIKVFQVCGQPMLGGARHRRKASLGFSSPYNNWHHDIKHGGSPTSQTSSEGFESLMREDRLRLRTTRDFWKNLPDSICSQLAAAPFELTNCWNGRDVSRLCTLTLFCCYCH